MLERTHTSKMTGGIFVNKVSKITFVQHYTNVT